MRKEGFTYIEIMIATTIFLILSIFIVRINITANKNIRLQIERQNMTMEAQKLLEKFKTATTDVGNYNNGDYEKVDNYYVVVQSKTVSEGPPKLLEVTIRVRKNIADKNNEVVLTSHFLKK
ncbi:type II secretion system GspH family protein [Clostridium sp. CX1]|uniref:type II secretion system protein n=1 Tax=Clostridium sp. CX1 TaxID=2978346 RepID=UPI0021BEC04D|nr:type II secretion system protein [Clostridium sp. CX1]MCT8976314.1 type II secretion system GspH family protein [Clostridium sp. CX1]